MRAMIDNLINGNLADAKIHAKRFSPLAIYQHLRQEGWTERQALAAAHFLKGRITWAQYCERTSEQAAS